MGYDKINPALKPELNDLDENKAMAFLLGCAQENLHLDKVRGLHYNLAVALSHLNTNSEELRKDKRINIIADYFIRIGIVKTKKEFGEFWAELYNIRRHRLGIFR